MKKLLLLLLLISTTLFSQDLENSKWYFGFEAALDFNTPSLEPNTLNNSSMIAPSGSASVADENGNLLFYTNGEEVWNSNHNPMDNGSDIGGYAQSYQSAIIVPSVTDENIYYIFTTSAGSVSSIGAVLGCRYSTIDMTMNSGLGKVVAKNQSLYYVDSSGNTLNLDISFSEKLTTYYNPNLNVHWVVIYHEGNYLTYKIDENGIEPTINDKAVVVSPSIYPIGPNPPHTYDHVGCNKISPDGSKFVSISPGQVSLYDFDSNTGIISNGNNIDDFTTSLPTGAEFSPDSNYLYISVYTQIFQTPLIKEKIKGGLVHKSKEGLFQVDLRNKLNFKKLPPQIIAHGTFYGLQLGINDKIYVGHISNTGININSLSVINSPNEFGTAANFQPNFIDLGTGYATSCSLPQKVAKIVKCGTNVCVTGGNWPVIGDKHSSSVFNYNSTAIESDCLGNVYSVGIWDSSNTTKLNKYDSLGNFQWSVDIIDALDMKVDNNSNLYILSSNSINKYNTNDGSLDWSISGSFSYIDVNKETGELYVGFGNTLQLISSNGSISTIDVIQNATINNIHFSGGKINVFLKYQGTILFNNGTSISAPNSGTWYLWAQYDENNILDVTSNIASYSTENTSFFYYNSIDNSIYHLDNHTGSLSTETEKIKIIDTFGNLQQAFNFSGVLWKFNKVSHYDQDSGGLYLFLDNFLIGESNVMEILNGQIREKLLNNNASDFNILYNRSNKAITKTGDCIYVKSSYGQNPNPITIVDGITLPTTGFLNTSFARDYILRLKNASFIFEKKENKNETVNLEKEKIILIYPNPTSYSVEVIFKEDLEFYDGTIELSNNFGVILAEKRYTGNKEKITFDLSNQPIGVYVLKFLTLNGESIIKKIVKL